MKYDAIIIRECSVCHSQIATELDLCEECADALMDASAEVFMQIKREMGLK